MDMKNIALTGILIGVMVMAFGFATVTVEEASTVHTTIQAAQATPFNVIVSDVNTSTDQRDLTLDCTTACIITGASLAVTSTDATSNIVQLSNCAVDGQELLTSDIADVANDVVSVVPTAGSAATDNDELLEQFFTSTTAITTIDLAINTGGSEPFSVMTHCGTGDQGNFAGGIGPETAGVRDFVIEYDLVTNGVTSTTEAVFVGFMTGTTEPTGAAAADT